MHRRDGGVAGSRSRNLIDARALLPTPHSPRSEGVRDMAPMMLGIVPFGIVCGVGAIAAGASPIAALAMSMIMFSGAAQIVATQLLAAGAPFAVILLSCLVVSLRLLMYSAAMAPYLRPLDHRWRNLLSFVLTDQAFAGTMQRFRDPTTCARTHRTFSARGVLLWVVWQLATVAGHPRRAGHSRVVAARVRRAALLPRGARAAAARPRLARSSSRSRPSRSSRSTRCRCGCR